MTVTDRDWTLVMVTEFTKDVVTVTAVTVIVTVTTVTHGGHAGLYSRL